MFFEENHWATLYSATPVGVTSIQFLLCYTSLEANNTLSFYFFFLIFLLTIFSPRHLIVITSYCQFPSKVIFIVTQKHLSNKMRIQQISNKNSIDFCYDSLSFSLYVCVLSSILPLSTIECQFHAAICKQQDWLQDIKANCFQQTQTKLYI